MFSRMFLVNAAERALRAFAAALVGALTAGFVITDASQWKAALLTAAVAALTSVLMSLAGSKVGDPDSPALLPAADTPDEDY